MVQGITNVYISNTVHFSALIVESLSPLNFSVNKINDRDYKIVLDSSLIMAPDTIYVFDGLVNLVSVTEKGGKSIVEVSLTYPSSYQVKKKGKLPAKLMILFDRYFLKSQLSDRVIVIDPGHGGKDLGHRGYINLLEKNVVMDVANYLKEDLISYGAYAVKTREKDVRIGIRDRISTAVLLEAEMFISLHTNWDRAKAVCGAKGTYWGKGGKILCESILEEIEKKPGLKNLGANIDEKFSRFLPHSYANKIPFVEIELCTISNPVEEGWLRSPVFKKRLACAISNGIVNYLFHNNNIDV